ncbi:MAG: hypothetical protein LBU23_11205 [Planctomycetota bacterium]|jgi:hypothetical protein|nr:hypothetical protein [Planctomycetota bacterium]
MLNQPEGNPDGPDASGYMQLSEDGFCLLEGDIIVNPKKASMIRKLDGKTLLYRPGVADPDLLPAKAFDELREILFADDEDDDFDLIDDDEDFNEDEDEDEDE